MKTTHFASGAALVLLLAGGLPAAPPPDIEDRPAAEAAQDESPAKDETVVVELEEHGSGMTLLNNDLIRLELKVTPEQKLKIQELIQSARKDAQEVYDKIPTKEQRTAAVAAARERANEVYTEYRTKIDAILTPEQKERLAELSVRVRGFKAVNDQEVANVLKLTEDQRKRVAKIVEDSQQRRRDIIRTSRRGGKDARQARRESLKRLRGEVDTKIKAVLTPAQLDAFVKMQGKPFDAESIPEDDAEIDLGESKNPDKPATETP